MTLAGNLNAAEEAMQEMINGAESDGHGWGKPCRSIT
jgi:hypothetical protein